jgi:hypothetical protein
VRTSTSSTSDTFLSHKFSPAFINVGEGGITFGLRNPDKEFSLI